MKVLITGSSGLLGGRLIHKLSQNHDIRITQTRDFYKYINNDLDYLIHAASPNNQDCKNTSITDQYIIQTQRMLDHCIKSDVKNIFFLSSTQVYKNIQSDSITEEAEINLDETNEYQTLKLRVEELFTKLSTDTTRNVVVLRISNGYGYPVDLRAKCWHLLVMDVCKQAIQTGKVKLRSNGEQYLDFIPVSAICQVFEKIIDGQTYIKSGIYNLTTGNPLKIKDFITMIIGIIEGVIDDKVCIEYNSLDNMISRKSNLLNTKLKDLDLNPSVNHNDEIVRLIDFCIANFKKK